MEAADLAAASLVVCKVPQLEGYAEGSAMGRFCNQKASGGILGYAGGILVSPRGSWGYPRGSWGRFWVDSGSINPVSDGSPEESPGGT